MSRARETNEIKAARLYQSGLTLHQVAAKLGMSPDRVRHSLARAGVTMRSPGRVRQIDAERAVRLYQTPMTIQQVADELGCSKSAVWNWLKRAGVTRTLSATCAAVREPRRQ